MKFRAVIAFDYDVPDDADERTRVYGTSDPAECARIDAQNEPIELLAYANDVSMTITPVIHQASK